MFLSDRAYNTLLERAHSSKWVRSTNHARGLSNFIEALSNLPLHEWHDTRPRHIRLSDHDRLQSGRPPYWSYEDPRRLRVLHPSDEAIQRLAHIALHFGTINPRRNLISDLSLVSSLLEAIGCSFIMPSYFPVNPKPLGRPAYRRKPELNW